MAENAFGAGKESVITVPIKALIKESEEGGYALFNMPKKGKFSGYRFLADARRVTKNPEEGTATVRLKSETAVRRDTETLRLSPDEMRAAYDAATDEDFEDVTYKVSIPADAVYARFSKATKVLMPYSSEYKGRFASVLNSCMEEDAADDKAVILNIPDWMYITVTDEKGKKVRLDAKKFASVLEDGKETYTDRTHWTNVRVPKEAVMNVYGSQTHFRMPAGKYEGYAYYLPNKMTRELKDGGLLLLVPETRKVYLKSLSGEKVAIDAAEFKALCDGAAADKFPAVSDELSEKFQKKAEELKERLPAQMTAAPDWVDVRVKKSGDEYYYSSSLYGAISKDGAGKTFEEAEAFGKRQRTDTLGFRFSGDGIVCVAVYDCFGDKGEITDGLAKRLLKAAGDTYAERDESGRNLHIFCLMDDKNLSHVSIDGKAEIFAASDFVAVTGDAVTASKTLAVFGSGSEAAKIISETFPAPRPVSPMSKADREIVEKAMEAEESGETFTSLYRGENTKGNENFCDENLMTRLACRTLGDRTAMIRIYNSSDRKNRGLEHMEHLALRAERQTASFVGRAKKDMKERRVRAQKARPADGSSSYRTDYKH